MGIVSRSQSGGAAAAPLFNSTLGVDTASIDTGAGGIAGGFSLLEIQIIARTDEAVVNGHFALTFNNDTGANYDVETVQGNNAVASAGPVNGAANFNLVAAGASQAAGVFAAVSLYVPFYALTTGAPQRAGWCTVSNVGTAAANSLIQVYGLNYRGTAAITRAKIINSGGTVLKAGTSMAIYGR